MSKKEQPACLRKTSIGGQALLEGIMMRGPKRTAIAVRNLKGEIVTEEWDTVTKPPAKIWTLPLFRGLYGLVTSLKVGYKALMRSAMLSGIEELTEEEERADKLKKLNKKRAKEGLPPLEYLPGYEPKEEPKEEAPAEQPAEEIKEEASLAQPAEEIKEEAPIEQSAEEPKEETPAEETVKAEEAPAQEPQEAAAAADEPAADEPSGKEEKPKKEKEEKSGMGGLLAGAAALGSILGVALAVVLFIWLPIRIYGWTLKDVVNENVYTTYLQMLIRSLFEGILRIIIFVAYMLVVSQLKDIKRTFMYHGAEHKTIFCYEGGLDLTVENVRKMRRFHPRCGTSFLIVMLILGILIGSFIPDFGLANEWLNTVLRSLCKIALFPLTVGLGYEFIRYAGKHDNLLVKILSAPGLWMQRISTKEPDDSMIECAITAVEKVIPDDGSDILGK